MQNVYGLADTRRHHAFHIFEVYEDGFFIIFGDSSLHMLRVKLRGELLRVLFFFAAHGVIIS